MPSPQPRMTEDRSVTDVTSVESAHSSAPPAVSDRPRPSVALLQRHPVLTVFGLAMAVRAAAAIVITQVSGASVFSDDLTYSQMASDRASGNVSNWDAYTSWLYHTTASFLYPLTALYKVVGPHPLAGRILVGLFGAIAAAATCRLALEALPVGWAMAAGLVVALLPSQVLFSSLILKDALVWALLALLAVVSAIASRASGMRLIVLLIAAGVLLGLLSHLREQTLVVAAWAFALAALVGRREGRAVRISGAVALLLVVPLWISAGVAGLTLVRDQQGTLPEKRAANAQGADTAFVHSTAPSSPDSATTDGSPPSTAGGDNVSAGVRGLQAVVLDPLPWQSSPNRRISLARAESTFAWWPLLLLAVIGLVPCRRHLRVVAFPLLAGAATAVTYALSEGNFGTAYRHRGEFVWVVALLAAMGAHHLVRLRHARLGG